MASCTLRPRQPTQEAAQTTIVNTRRNSGNARSVVHRKILHLNFIPMAKHKLPIEPEFKLHDEVWALYDRKFQKKKITGVCAREKDKDWVYFLEGQLWGNDGWYLEEQLFTTKEELIESMQY